MSVSRKVLTLAMVRKGDSLLLGLKKKGFGEGKWNGFGGKVEKGETIEEAAARELEEESGIVSKDMKKVGLLEFEFVGDPTLLEVHVFSVNKYEGEIQESEEMRPKWFSIEDIPYESMWADDLYWYPIYLQGNIFKGYFLYRGHDVILKHTLNIVEEQELCA